ncbi:hypothetical protein NIES4071_32490 [Calothrix sp. NIES-4071]|nr:hypothetical protein NIES4071_32490 [Calothrix sp. NIES-4071]BAZ57569.1 hypothetical protein NIES4105_32430 [Calothrix sp. NIES-4105]
MAPKQPKYSKEEFARLGEEIYERDIYPPLQPDSKGKIVAIDIMTGAWEIDSNEIIACRRKRRTLSRRTNMDFTCWL